LYEQCSSAKKYFRPGGVADSEWTRSARAGRGTLVEDHSMHIVNTTHGVAFLPPNAVSSFLLALSISYFKQTQWPSGKL
jgi:hypothetical protein